MKCLNPKRLTSLVCILLISALLLAGCGADQSVKPQGKAYFNYFDTVSYIYSYAGDTQERFEELASEGAAVLMDYHRLFDIYHEYSDINNLCTVNRAAGGAPIKVDVRLIDFLLSAKALYEATGGNMNIMLGAVTSLWHDCREEAAKDASAAHIPEANVLRAAAEHIDFSALEIDPQQQTVRITDPEASIDVGALGKGYATEMAAKHLEELDAQSYVLNVGGNIRIIGTKKDGTSWVTGIRDPNAGEGDFVMNLSLADTACVTSGVYERYFTVDSVRYHHVIDPDTLYPACYFASVTVVTGDSALADALSTALFCMSYEEGSVLAAQMGVDVLWVYADGSTRMTSGLASLQTE